MNKKIISIFFLLIVLVSILVSYIYLNQTSTEEKEYSGSIGTVDDKSISDEVDDVFIEEDDEIEIGEMI